MTKYICNLCKKEFTDSSNYKKHIFNKKKACIPQDECLKLRNESMMNESRAYYFQMQLDLVKKEKEEKEIEIERLKKMVEQDIKDFKDEVKHVNKVIESGFNNVEKQIEKQNTFNSSYNNCVVNNNQQLCEERNNNFNFSLSLPKKERLDHISKQDMLWILDKKEFPESVGLLMENVYFSPNCPHNWSWCVTDEQATFGTLEYNHESNSLIRENTTTVITKRLQNVMLGMSNVLEELRMTAAFNDQQGINYSKFYNMVGRTTIDPDIIRSIRQRAYVGRNLSKALWKRLGMPIETTEVDSRVVLKTI